jgi:simple sugar transport system permease protein
VGRELWESSRLLIAAHPRGLDVLTVAAAKPRARRGLAILLISSDLAEIWQVADRVMVLRAGRLLGRSPSWSSCIKSAHGYQRQISGGPRRKARSLRRRHQPAPALRRAAGPAGHNPRGRRPCWSMALARPTASTKCWSLGALAIVGLGITVAFRANVYNIGADGQVILGGIVSVIALKQPAISAWQRSAARRSMPAGCLVRWPAGCVRASTPEIIVTIMLNYVAVQLLRLVVRGPIQEDARCFRARYARRFAALPSSLLARCTRDRHRRGAGCDRHIVLRRTVFGFHVDAVGEAGGRVWRHASAIIVLSMVVSGGLCGLAGGIEVSGAFHRLEETVAPGVGLSGIAVALMARLNALAVPFTALVFGILTVGAAALQRQLGVPYPMLWVIEAAVIFAFLMVAARQQRRHGWRGDGPDLLHQAHRLRAAARDADPVRGLGESGLAALRRPQSASKACWSAPSPASGAPSRQLAWLGLLAAMLAGAVGRAAPCCASRFASIRSLAHDSGASTGSACTVFGWARRRARRCSAARFRRVEPARFHRPGSFGSTRSFTSLDVAFLTWWFVAQQVGAWPFAR